MKGKTVRWILGGVSILLVGCFMYFTGPYRNGTLPEIYEKELANAEFESIAIFVFVDLVADDGSVSSELLYGSIDSGFEELIDYLFSLEVQQIRSSIRQDLSLPYGKGTFDISIYSNDDTISGSLVSMNVEGPGSFTISVNQGHKSHYHHYVLENDEIFDINYIFSFFDELD